MSEIVNKIEKARALAEATVEALSEELETTTNVTPSRRGKVAISAYFDKAVRQQLAILATREEKSQAALMAEALNLLFEKYRKPPIAKA